ncbi:MAG: recombinase family protein, partial [Thomasclavelia ramosa]
MYGMYLRKSRSDDPNEDINDTLAKHEKILFDLADSLNINRKEIMQFKEVVSGENIQNRPEMKKLLEYVMEGVLEGVLVVDSQRLARGDTVDQGTIIRAFSINNTKIITPMKTIDPQNEYDQEYFEFDLFMGRREYKMITRRMQRGRHIAAQEGYYVGSIAPYSFSRIKLD